MIRRQIVIVIHLIPSQYKLDLSRDLKSRRRCSVEGMLIYDEGGQLVSNTRMLRGIRVLDRDVVGFAETTTVEYSASPRLIDLQHDTGA